jgi:hypothetical protein
MKPMPGLGAKCVSNFNDTLSIVGATESLWLTAPPTTYVRSMLKVPQLEALYEAAFLRIFTAYENFLEDTLTHFMAGYKTPGYSPVAVASTTLHASVSAALQSLTSPRRPYAMPRSVSGLQVWRVGGGGWPAGGVGSC